MSAERVRVDWVSDHVFLLRDRNSFPIVMTQPEGANGADLLPLSLIGCAAWDVVTIVQKQRQALTGLAVTACSERDAEPPWRYRKIHINYQFTGRGLKARLLERAVALAERKYCSIYATLREVVEIESVVEVVEG